MNNPNYTTIKFLCIVTNWGDIMDDNFGTTVYSQDNIEEEYIDVTLEALKKVYPEPAYEFSVTKFETKHYSETYYQTAEIK